MATVDVIIPAYNAAKYLRDAIESVLAQEFQDWKIVLVNDGSTDDTDQVIAPYLQRLGGKILYIKQANRGLPAARNTAIRSSTAEFLALLDADDIWLPCRLSESVKIFRERSEVGLTYGGITLIDPEGQTGKTYEGNRKNSPSGVVSKIYTREIHLPCPTMTFRRRCIDEVGLFDESMRATEDRDLWLRIAQHYEVAFIPKAIAYYRISPNSMSTDSLRMLQAQLQFIRKHSGSPGCGRLARRMALASAYKQRAEGLAREGRRWNAFLVSIQAAGFYPFSYQNFKTVGSLFVQSIASWKRHKT